MVIPPAIILLLSIVFASRVFFFPLQMNLRIVLSISLKYFLGTLMEIALNPFKELK